MDFTKIKVLASDIDGTLWPYRSQNVDHELIARLRQLPKEGYLFTLVSGRPVFAMREFAQIFGVDGPMISCNGAILFHGEQILYQHPMNLAKIWPFLLRADALGATILVYSEDTEYCMTETEWVLKHRAMGKFHPLLDRKTHVEKMGNKTYKINLFSMEGLDLSPLHEEAEALRSDFGVAVYGDMGYEFVAKGVSKAHGLEQLASYLQCSLEDIAVIGDNNNDMEMVQEAGIGCVVANATPDVAAVADYQTEEESTAGVYALLQEINRQKHLAKDASQSS